MCKGKISKFNSTDKFIQLHLKVIYKICLYLKHINNSLSKKKKIYKPQLNLPQKILG